MNKVYRCSEVNDESLDCEYQTSGSEDEVFTKAVNHWMQVHGLEEEEISEDLEDQIRSAMDDDDTLLDEENEY